MEEISQNSFYDWFIFSAKIDYPTSIQTAKRYFLFMVVGVTIFSGIRQIFRNRIAGDIDLVNVIITIVLTITFYPLLYLSYQFAYRGTEEKETTVVMRSVSLVGQLAILRDGFYCVFAIIMWRLALFESGSDFEREGVSIIVFVTLDAILWWLTIIFLMPLVIARLKTNMIETQKTFITPFLLSTIIFWITWVFNYIIIRIFIELPLGREFLS